VLVPVASIIATGNTQPAGQQRTWKIQGSLSSDGLDRMRSVMLTICRSAIR
jgi:hypothetical protein